MAKSTVPSIWQTPTTNVFTKQFEIGLGDHMAVRYARSEPLPFGRFAGFITLCTLSIGLFFAFDTWQREEHVLAAAIVVGAIAAGPALAWLVYGFFRAQFIGFWKGFLETREAIDVPMEMTVDAKGVFILIRQQTWLCPWNSLVSVEEDAERYYFWTSKFQAHILPKRVFENDEAEAFAKALRKWWGEDPVSPPRRLGVRTENV
ncbi:YcxB family protein [Agrobacterium larrymoorei]|uniref:YcxB family protein n=1 Tax=Agrobacterium larrymoorei TaxID=160699 RepID=UPI001572E7EC|nr:YcxB family protein [Agrobacterium larrymoorei]NTJ41555.1 YcxB family protein [Agrobacterium larrymoorei]